MKSYHVNKGAGLAGLMLKEHDTPTPGPREVLVRVRANSLNQRELMVMQGNFFTLRRIALGNRAHFTAMNQAISEHQLKPVINRVFAFDDARAAHQYYVEQPRFGKVVISNS